MEISRSGEAQLSDAQRALSEARRALSATKKVRGGRFFLHP